MFNEFNRYDKINGIDFSINWLNLSYCDHALEIKFKGSYFENNLQLGRACHLIAIAFYCIFAIWNALVIDTSNVQIWFFISSLVTILFLSGLTLSYYGFKHYKRFWQQIFAFYVFMTGSGFAIVTMYSKSYDTLNYLGIIFCLIFCYSFIKLTFLWAVLAGNTIVFFYAISALISIGPSLKLLSIVSYMFGINLLGIMVCYSLELMSRRDFKLNYLIKEAESKTKDMNVKLESMVKERTKELDITNEDLKTSVKREKNLVERLRSEEKILQKSLDSLEQAEDIARLGYFEWNWEKEENYWSKGFFKLMGFDNSESLTYLDFLEFIHEEDRQRIRDNIEISINNHETVNIEFTITQRDGSIIQFHGIADHFYNNDKPLKTRGIFQDITDRKIAEESLKLLEGKLIQAQKMEAIGRLAGGVAHDYNNISSIIIGYSELSLDKIEKVDPLYKNLSSILNAAYRATDITRQLLAFARKQTIVPKVIDLNKTVTSMLKILKRLIGEDINLDWKPGDEIWPIRIDPSQIDQILANLCVNARDAILNIGRIIIETKNISFDDEYCSTHSGFIPGSFTMLAVSDNGTGMKQETMDKIFEPFFTTKGLGQGTGLGLATVYGIIKQNDGFINVYSEYKNGTTIKIYLPQNTGKPVEEFYKNTGEISLGFGETILLVEDDISILELGREMLDNLGYDVLVANTPTEAIYLATNHNKDIHILITDVVMPEMNGRDLANHLQSIYEDLKVLFMSGYTANVISHHGVLEEGVNFISKPFSKMDLSEKIRDVLDNK
ncbi:MAG: response regulator [Deltaproteobacteria bacterium]|nr:response regulator [Deltaproteobacteria bacterium]